VSGDSLDARKLAAARLWAANRMPYLATALFACGVRADPGSSTIGVDQAWHVRADPTVVDTLPADQLGRLLVHLTGHLIRDHAGRAQHLSIRDDHPRARWNRCADAEINDDLIANDCVPDVAADLPSDLGCAPGGLAEHYYDHAGAGARRWDCGSGADGQPRPGEGQPRPGDGETGLDAGQIELLRIGVAADIRRHQANEPGSVPAGWLRWAESVLPSRIDWRRVLAAEVRRAVAAIAGNVDYTYQRPSRRAHLHTDVVMPTLHRPIPDVAIICDTSGSMHEELLARALAEVEAVLTRAGLRRGRVRVLAVDTAVHAVRRVSRAAHVDLAGGGGTDMGAGIDAAAALRPRPSVIIVLTDGYTPWPGTPPPGIRVIVGLLTEEATGPEWRPPAWARTVEIGDGDASA
jgi:predicted metal-dependent peptidase